MERKGENIPGPLGTWEDSVRELDSALSAFLGLPEWQFRQVPAKSGRWDGPKPVREIRKQPITWTTADGTVFLCRDIVFPESLEGIPLRRADASLTFVIPARTEVRICGKHVHSNRYWADSRPCALPLTGNIRPFKRYPVSFRVAGGNGLGSFSATLHIGPVDRALLDLRAILWQMRFARAILRWNRNPAALSAAYEDALKRTDPEAIRRRDWRGISRQTGRMEEALEPFRDVAGEFTVHLVGHAHIDMNWLWPYRDTIDTCVGTFRSVCRLMREYPELTFTQSQSHIYEIVRRHEPALFREVLSRIKQGRWEAAASTWVEADLNMPHGESIARQILLARRYMGDTLRTSCTTFWSPDTFGHPETLPSILSHAGIRNYYFMRCGPGVPLFWWESRDGSRLLCFTSRYNNAISSETILPEVISFRDRYPLSDMLFVYGVGDHGGGPARADIENRRLLESRPVMPRLRFSTADDFFSAVRRRRTRLPVVRGELNPVFEGCYTTHADIKRYNRECERLLLTTEVLDALAWLPGKNSSRGIARLWQPVLFNQFHDILDGSAIPEAYSYSAGLARSVLSRVRRMTAGPPMPVTGQCGSVILRVTNPLGWKHETIAAWKLPSGWKNACLMEQHCRELPAVVRGNRLVFFVRGLPAFGSKYLTARRAPVQMTGCSPGKPEPLWENRFHRVRFDPETGILLKVYDKVSDRHVVKAGGPETGANTLKVFWEGPHAMSAWNIGKTAFVDPLPEGTFRKECPDALGVVFSCRRRYRNSWITQRTFLYRHLPWIDFELSVGWREQGGTTNGVPMLRACFPLSFRRPRAVFQVPFGSCERDSAGREWPAGHWAAFREDGCWVGLLNREKHGYHVGNRTLSLTVLRNPYEPDACPDAGRHSVRYRLVFGKFSALMLSRQAAEFNMPPVIVPGACGKRNEPPLFEAEGSVLITCVKRSWDGRGTILRLAELEGKSQTTTIRFLRRPRKVELSGLMEESLSTLPVRNNRLTFKVRPWTLVTLRIEF